MDNKIDNYDIDPNYVSRSSITHHDDTKDNGEYFKDYYQKEVYEEVNKYIATDDVVLDIGCGSAWKLVNTVKPCNKVGVEIDPTYSWLLNNYHDNGSLRFVNFNEFKPDNMKNIKVTVCSDVIEHVENPDEFLKLLCKIDSEYFILSTPDRCVFTDKVDMGPPENPHHYREWRSDEFYKFLSRYFNIIDYKITDVKNSTMMFVVTKK